MEKDYIIIPNFRLPILYKYHKSNKCQSYQEDAQQIIFKPPEELYRTVKKKSKMMYFNRF